MSNTSTVTETATEEQKGTLIAPEPISDQMENKVFNFGKRPSLLAARTQNIDLDVWDAVDKGIKDSQETIAVAAQKDIGEMDIVPAFDAMELSQEGKEVNVMMRDVGDKVIIEEDVADDDGNLIGYRYWVKSDSDELVYKAAEKHGKGNVIAFDQIPQDVAKTQLEGGKMLIRMKDMRHEGLAKYDIKENGDDAEGEGSAESGFMATQTRIRIGAETFTQVFTRRDGREVVLYVSSDDARELNREQVYQELNKNRVGKVEVPEGQKQVVLKIHSKNFVPVKETQFENNGDVELSLKQDPRVIESMTDEEHEDHVVTVALTAANLAQMAGDGVLEASVVDSKGEMNFGSTSEEVKKNRAITEVADNLINLNGVEAIDLGDEHKQRQVFLTPISTNEGRLVVVRQDTLSEAGAVVRTNQIRLVDRDKAQGWVESSEKMEKGELDKKITSELGETQKALTFSDEIKGFDDISSNLD